MSSSFDSWEYHPLIHLKSLFQTPESLNELPQLLDHTYLYKKQLDSEIQLSIALYNEKSRAGSTPDDIKSNISKLVSGIDTIKSQTAIAEGQITQISSTIQKLDQTKKNLVSTMTMVKRLQMLIQANETLTMKLPLKNYHEILLYFSVVKELGAYFKPYNLIDEIVSLNSTIKRTQNKLVDDIYFDYEEVVAGHQEHDMAPAGEILEVVSPQHREKLVSWFCNNQLNEIKTIFRLSEEAGSLENVSRRFIFFKKVLLRVQLDLSRLFPVEWKIEILLIKLFCEFTRSDLENVLSFYFRDQRRSDPDVLLTALNATLEFERFLGDSLDTGIFDQAILHSFEPYLLVWISQQEQNINSKFVEYLGNFKLSNELSLAKDASELLGVLRDGNVPPNIAPSCAELFRHFRTILAQASKLSHGPILIDLSDFFNLALKKYADQILEPSLPSEDDEGVFLGVEAFKYLTMVLNTADYCLTASEQLESKINQTIDQDLAKSISFEDSRQYFLHLISRCTNLLLTKLLKDLEFSWRQFQNINWADMNQTGDVLRYMGDVERVINETIHIVTPLIIREGYAWNLHNKVVEAVVNTFMNQWKKIRPGVTEINAEQLMLDLVDLKANFLKIQTDMGGMAKSYSRFVVSQTSKAETILKLLSLPVKPIDDFVENYFILIGDRSVDNFIRILDLKGLHDNGAYIDNFNLQLATGDHTDLADFNGAVAILKSEGEEAAEKIRRPIVHKKPLPVPQVRLPKPPQINIANIEKGFKELAMNGESRVNKMGENFKSFGKFFRKD